MTENRAAAFIALGEILRGVTVKGSKEIYESASRLADYIPQAISRNGWFDEENVTRSISALSQMLAADSLQTWIDKYEFKATKPKRVGVLLAGNLPLVGFHDFLCVLISGNIFVGKLSTKDDRLLRLVADILIEIAPELASQIEFTEGPLDSIEAIIATGSDNTSRHIEYYFGKYPNIIRSNRNAVAVLDGTESEEELENLGHDIFDYYGLGCRSVSKLYVPEGYDLDLVFKGLFSFSEVVHHKKYGNNYDYYKAIYLMGNADLIENGFILLKEDQAIASPVAVLHYEYYSDASSVVKLLSSHEDEVQCVVANKEIARMRTVAFGQTQVPAVDDYADGVDTMTFLVSL